MKIILAITAALMTAAGSIGIVDFKNAYDKNELPFLQQEHKISKVQASVNRDRRLKKQEHLTSSKMDFFFDGFSRGMIDYEEFLPLVLEESEESLLVQEEVLDAEEVSILTRK